MKKLLISLSVLLIASGCATGTQISECPNGKTFAEIHENLKKLITEKGVETELGDSQIDYTFLAYTIGDIWMSLNPNTGAIDIVDNSEDGDQYGLSNTNGGTTISHPGKSKNYEHEIEHLCNKVLNTISF